jgi:cytochrome c5
MVRVPGVAVVLLLLSAAASTVLTDPGGFAPADPLSPSLAGAPRSPLRSGGRARGAPRAQENPGQAAYTRICQVCHGPEGRGDAGPSLVPLDKEYEEVLAIVREGGGQMPPISAERVSDDDVKHIVEYLKSLKTAQ